MRDSEKKLRRGLKELSVLFDDIVSDEHVPVLRQTPPLIPGIDCLSVFDSRGHADASLLLSLCASKLANKKNLCTVVSVGPSHLSKNPPCSIPILWKNHSGLLEEESLGHYFNRFAITWEQFNHICRRQQKFTEPAKPLAHQTVCLDFDYNAVPHFQKVIPMLDKCLLLIQPHAENMTETYKMVKATVALNPDLDYYFIYDGLPDDPRGEMLFERFSEMTARRLGVHLTWLGHFYLDGHEKRVFENLKYDLLYLNRKPRTESIEKFMLAGLVRPTLHAEMGLAV